MTLDTQPASGTETAPRSRRIAVIGSGIAGLSCAWLLAKRHRVTVFGRDRHVGGHANTVEVETPDGPLAVDTGFIVYNTRNYPNLVALFDHLNAPTAESDMSFAVSVANGALEYAGTDLNGLFAQRRNLVNPRFWRMVGDIARFYREAPSLLEDDAGEALTLGDYLDANGYGDAFASDHLLPMAAAIWSTPTHRMRRHPVREFVRFCDSHGLLKLTGRPTWRTVCGGSREYVSRLTASFAASIRLGDPVVSVKRPRGRPLVLTRSGMVEQFEAVVFASHADQTVSMLADADPFERDVLDGFPYQQNRAVLHSDARLMPRRRRVWSSWNFLKPKAGDGEESVCVTYWMNRLQPLETDLPLFVTLNPAAPVDEAAVHRELMYRHPVFDHRAPTAQRRIWSLQGRRNTWYCGSYLGAGFHEDALQSGLAVAEMLGGARRPWTVENESGRISPPDRSVPLAAAE